MSYQKRGYHVFATARSPSKIEHFASVPNVTCLALDVESSASIKAAVEIVKEEVGSNGLNVLVNNSGRSYPVATLDADLDVARSLFEVNFWGLVTMTEACAPLLIAAKGAIVNIGSVAGELNSPFIGFYGASKAAVTHYSESLRLELAPFDVRVITVTAGMVQSQIFQNSPDLSSLPSSSLYKPIEKEVCGMMTGANLPKGMDTDEFVGGIVRKIEGGSNGKIWGGTMSTMGWILTGFVPTFVLDYALASQSGLTKLKGRMAEKKV
ncbi:hypothetical protein MMC25_005247 [Agyrium rufum]|nr:hypothetical protein [Agyrium rufum]